MESARQPLSLTRKGILRASAAIAFGLETPPFSASHGTYPRQEEQDDDIYLARPHARPDPSAWWNLNLARLAADDTPEVRALTVLAALHIEDTALSASAEGAGMSVKLDQAQRGSRVLPR